MDDQQHSPTSPFAKFMIWGLWITIFCVVFSMLYFSSRGKDYFVINGLNGHYSTSGEINDTPVYFLLDTGATHVVVSNELASVLGLENFGEAQMLTANGTVTGYRSELDRVSFGPITLTGVDAIVNPAMDGNEVLLGMSALRQVEFSQKGSNLTISQVK